MTIFDLSNDYIWPILWLYLTYLRTIFDLSKDYIWPILYLTYLMGVFGVDVWCLYVMTIASILWPWLWAGSIESVCIMPMLMWVCIACIMTIFQLVWFMMDVQCLYHGTIVAVLWLVCVTAGVLFRRQGSGLRRADDQTDTAPDWPTPPYKATLESSDLNAPHENACLDRWHHSLPLHVYRRPSSKGHDVDVTDLRSWAGVSNTPV